MPKLVAALLAAVLAAATLAACGGGSSSDSTGATTAGEPASPGHLKTAKEKIEAKIKELRGGEEKQAGGGSKAQSGSRSGSGSGSSSGHSKEADVPPLKVSGGGSSKYRTKGGDNSIQDFGEESDDSELQQAAEALHAFYAARSEERWATACSYLTKQLVKQFEVLASRSPQLKDAGCPEALHAFTRPLPASVEREVTLVNAVSLRREGEQAFLIYLGAEGKVYAVPMQLEGGAWKVGSIAGTPLS